MNYETCPSCNGFPGYDHITMPHDELVVWATMEDYRTLCSIVLSMIEAPIVAVKGRLW